MTIQKREESLIKKVNNLDNEIKKEVDKLGKDFNLGNITKEEYKKQIRRCKAKKTENGNNLQRNNKNQRTKKRR